MDILPDHILDKIIQIPIPVNNIDDKIAWNFHLMENFFENGNLGK